MKMETIITVSGKSGLFEILNKSKSHIIAQSLVDGKKLTIPITKQLSSLSEISIYTEDEEIMLYDFILKIGDYLTENTDTHFDQLASNDEKLNFFVLVMPELDTTRFYPSHAKKVYEWYTILKQHDALDDIKTFQDKVHSELAKA